MLTDSKIRSAKNLEKSYKLTDALGLYLTISTHGAKRWYFRYTFDRKENRLALGSYPLVSLAAARKLLASGVCPSLQPRRV
ncbi:hypothetical protein CS369_02875 [Candidatus Symbiopectobacterium sp. 'North America']|nr:hypothetical protein [Candidatus Symbiopectobacterium sp. 'North America']